MGARWVVGDHCGLAFPADPASLRAAGVEFLTEAFRASGVLSDGAAVTKVTEFAEAHGGSTGRKAVLAVEYGTAVPTPHTDLFVKFSRDFDNPIRDRGKTQLEPEVRFGSLARTPGFPVAVPTVLFGDYHRDSGSGILITERIRFGANGIEPQYHKCLDYEMPEPFAHYRALLAALGRLAGTHRSGRLPAEHFALDLQAATVGERTPVSVAKLERRVDQLADFAEAHPGLLPVSARSPEFLARLRDDVPRVALHEDSIVGQLADDADYVALCHWNANIDNAWFWRDADGALRCGLMDWGCVGQMNMGMAIWGTLSGAETYLWERHLDELLKLFADEVRRHGGPELDVARLRRHTLLYAAAMGVAWLLDVPVLIHKRFDIVPSNRKDPRIRNDESVRAPLQMLANLLTAWERHRVGDLLDAALGEVTA